MLCWFCFRLRYCTGAAFLIGTHTHTHTHTHTGQTPSLSFASQIPKSRTNETSLTSTPWILLPLDPGGEVSIVRGFYTILVNQVPHGFFLGLFMKMRRGENEVWNCTCYASQFERIFSVYFRVHNLAADVPRPFNSAQSFHLSWYSKWWPWVSRHWFIPSLRTTIAPFLSKHPLREFFDFLESPIQEKYFSCSDFSISHSFTGCRETLRSFGDQANRN